MFETLQIFGLFVLAIVAIIGLCIGVVLAVFARRKEQLRRPAIKVLCGAAVLFLIVVPMGLLMFREFYLNENLVFACRRGDLAEAKWLLSHGASPDAQFKSNDDALGAASEGGYRELVELLLNKGAKVDHEDIFGRTALQRAREAGNADIVLLLQQSEQSQQK